MTHAGAAAVAAVDYDAGGWVVAQAGKRWRDDGDEPPGKTAVGAVAAGVVPGVVPAVQRGVLDGSAPGRVDRWYRLRARPAAVADISCGVKGVREFPGERLRLALGRWGIGRALSRRARVRSVVAAAVPGTTSERSGGDGRARC